MTDRLSRFTPNASGLDRDAILYAAGRRSARGAWAWKALAGLLAASQMVTLVVLWPRPNPVAAVVPPPPAVAPAPEAPAPPPSPPGDVWTAGSWPDELRERPAQSTVEYVQPDPPLSVRSGLRFD